MEKRNLGYRLTIISLMTIGFIIVSMGVHFDLFIGLDNSVEDFVYSFRAEGTNKLFLVITFLGEIKLLVLLMVLIVGYLVLVLGRKQRLTALIVFLSIVGTVVLQDILKELFQRPRPEILQIIEAPGYGFPSGHTMISTAFYWVLG